MISGLELTAQRAITAAFVDADPFPCILTREVKVSDGSGGYTTTKQPQPVQWLRMIPLQDSTQERQTPDGRKVSPGYMLQGKYGADIKRMDTFTKDGRRYEVVFVVENQQYQVKAEVIYSG